MNKVSKNEKIALDWIAAFRQHDLETLLKLYSEDAVHYSPKLKLRLPDTNGWIKGKSSLREWWADAFERIPSLQYQLINLIANDSSVFMEYLRKVNGEADMMVGEVLEIENNLIVKSRVYHG